MYARYTSVGVFHRKCRWILVKTFGIVLILTFESFCLRIRTRPQDLDASVSSLSCLTSKISPITFEINLSFSKKILPSTEQLAQACTCFYEWNLTIMREDTLCVCCLVLMPKRRGKLSSYTEKVTSHTRAQNSVVTNDGQSNLYLITTKYLF